ncbi:bifunctional DNA primase/polymerase [Polyangium sp. 6x1]|uniref:bifunctional DNA primase/polymerase n=1 Tax=Polyangium sp. 6x1 TaxID=3042689 RepID=UPI002482B0D8|nr:bifunctional DNA primase/polymerase [Polyangium sp. 6x1]MDI1451718.1 bifunctional DNA primase/polymerase [Polyangium sp. 6x1]
MIHASAALWYAARGWPVFPVAWPVPHPNGVRCACFRGPRCDRMGKHPWAPLAPHGLRDATTDARMVSHWWRRAPRASVGVVLGERAGAWVLDIDAKGGGLDTLAAIEREHGPLPPTLRAATGGGGFHLVFLWPGRRVVPRVHALGPGVDVRGDDSYIVASPSVHASGRPYRWLDSAAPVLMAPAWLGERVMAPPELPVSSPSLPSRPASIGASVSDRARAYLRALPPAVSGQRGHDTTFRAALALVRGFDLEPSAALALLAKEYNPRCQPPWNRKALEHKVASAARARVSSGYLLRGRRG